MGEEGERQPNRSSSSLGGSWVYEPKKLGISAADQAVLEAGGVRSQDPNPGFPDPAFAGLSDDCAVFNSCYLEDSETWRSAASPLHAKLDRYLYSSSMGTAGSARVL